MSNEVFAALLALVGSMVGSIRQPISPGRRMEDSMLPADANVVESTGVNRNTVFSKEPKAASRSRCETVTTFLSSSLGSFQNSSRFLKFHRQALDPSKNALCSFNAS